MSLLHCTNCTTAYSVGAPRCPHCGSTDHTDDSAPPPAHHAPAQGATKAEWVEHAVALGWSEPDAAALTKHELIAALTDADAEQQD